MIINKINNDVNNVSFLRASYILSNNSSIEPLEGSEGSDDTYIYP